MRNRKWSRTFLPKQGTAERTYTSTHAHAQSQKHIPTVAQAALLSQGFASKVYVDIVRPEALSYWDHFGILSWNLNFAFDIIFLRLIMYLYLRISNDYSIIMKIKGDPCENNEARVLSEHRLYGAWIPRYSSTSSVFWRMVRGWLIDKVIKTVIALHHTGALVK